MVIVEGSVKELVMIMDVKEALRKMKIGKSWYLIGFLKRFGEPFVHLEGTITYMKKVGYLALS